MKILFQKVVPHIEEVETTVKMLQNIFLLIHQNITSFFQEVLKQKLCLRSNVDDTVSESFLDDKKRTTSIAKLLKK